MLTHPSGDRQGDVEARGQTDDDENLRDRAAQVPADGGQQDQDEKNPVQPGEPESGFQCR